jgi:hypothetical protein
MIFIFWLLLCLLQQLVGAPMQPPAYVLGIAPKLICAAPLIAAPVVAQYRVMEPRGNQTFLRRFVFGGQNQAGRCRLGRTHAGDMPHDRNDILCRLALQQFLHY